MLLKTEAVLYKIKPRTNLLLSLFNQWRAANFYLCSALRAIEQWGFFSVPHLLWHGASVYNGHLRGPYSIQEVYLSRIFYLHLMDDAMLEFIQNVYLNIGLMCGLIYEVVWYFELFSKDLSFTWIYIVSRYFKSSAKMLKSRIFIRLLPRLVPSVRQKENELDTCTTRPFPKRRTGREPLPPGKQTW